MKMKKPLSLLLLCIPVLLLAQVDVQIAANGQMYISKSAYVYVDNSGDFNIDSTGQLIMDSDSVEYSNLYVDGTSTGDTAEYWRFVATSATRDLIGAPVSGEAYNVFHARNSANLVAGTQGGDFLFGPYDNTSTTGVYYESSASDTYTLDPGIGYRAASSGGNLEFKGSISTGNVAVPITYGGEDARFGESNLIANPYTTYVSATALLTEMSSSGALDASFVYIYAYDGTIGSGSSATDGSLWERVNNAYIVTNGSDIYIAPGQGFLVYADSGITSDSITFTKSMQTVMTGEDDFIPGRVASSSPLNTNLDAEFQLKIQNTLNASSDNTQIYFFDNNVSRGLDIGWDAGVDPTGLSISTLLVEDNQGVPFDLQCLHSDDIMTSFSDIVVPLHINASAGVDYTISIENENLPVGATVYLHDTLDNSLTLLNDEDYTFNSSTALTGAGRFFLRTSSQNSLSNNEFSFNSLNVTSIINSKTLLVEGYLTSETQLNLYDVSGRLITNYTLNSDSQTSERYIDVSGVSEGVYIAQLTNSENQTKSNKVIIK